MSKECSNCLEESPDDAIRCVHCNFLFVNTDGGMPTQEPDLVLTEKSNNYEIRISAESIIQSVGNALILGREGDVEPTYFSQHKQISRKHCKIYFQDGIYFIETIPSATNPTKINHNKLIDGIKEKLHEGDTLTLADKDFHVSRSVKQTEQDSITPQKTVFVVICPKCGTNYEVSDMDSRIEQCDYCDDYDKYDIAKVTAKEVVKNAN